MYKLILLFVSLAFTGCVTLYKPNIIHSPMLKSEGELHGAFGLGLSGSGMLNLQSAYAVTDHFGVMVDGMAHFRRTTTGGSIATEKLNIFSGEIGGGYFDIFNEKKTRLFQVYGGAGLGTTSDKIDGLLKGVPTVSSEYYNIFLQPGIGWVHPNVEFAFDTRINYVHLYDVHAFLYDEFDWWNTDFKFANDTSLSFVNFEPTITLKAGSEKVKVHTQLGLTIPVINTESYFLTNNASLLGGPLIKFSLGVVYKLK